MQFTFCPLYSGSSGNALFVGAGHTRVLIDAGLSGRTVCGALEQIDIAPETLDAILITHEHIDHVRGVGVLSRRYRIPVYANEATWNAMERQIGSIAIGNRRVFETGESFYIGDLSVLPFTIPHDAADPVGYRIYYGGRSVATATDIGQFNKRLLSSLSGTDLLLLESNHDPEMLMHNEHYSSRLKARILGTSGHLSNEACVRALLHLYKTGVHHVILGHLSGENNTPELARRTVCEGLSAAGLSPECDCRVDMAWRDHIGAVYTLE